MWPIIRNINLLRYLIIWRVNSSIVWQPGYLPLDLSLTLGTTIGNRLPTSEARQWHKLLAPWAEQATTLSRRARRRKKTKGERQEVKFMPDAGWPIESVLFPYRHQTNYGKGELLLWELKLFGDSADHAFFLEVILPAMEEISLSASLPWHHPYGLWGHFDIQAVYVAHGEEWEPVIEDGRLDLSVRPTSTQWSDGLNFNPDTMGRLNRLIWLTPATFYKSDRFRRKPFPPSLQTILQALLTRLGDVLPEKRYSPEEIAAQLTPEGGETFEQLLERADAIPVQRHTFKRVPKTWPRGRQGEQTFASIPQPFIPYLNLASILHIGRHTHFGYGTFVAGYSI
ncbi:MAG: CRISPR system precrRNA processing endoribonuclease RAMP protein Cas6 [Caldilineae bacterium]|nr:MAG: CRISPR system precrRNA processing endoribonuclease RAMP protein Cas6 [Caldilineae bacterium]